MRKDIFVNCSNHPSKGWQDSQKNAALEYGEIVDVPFPNVGSEITNEELDALVDDTVNKILEYKPKAVMLMGEFVTSYKIVNKLKENNIKVLVSVTERNSKEVKGKDGVINKTSVFDFKGFREY